jgi:hypothetical protein
MPIKASYADAFYRAHPNPNPKTNPDPKTNPNPNHRYADAFYRACANDRFCDTGSFWSCKGQYHQYLADEEAEKDREIEACAR